MTTKTIKVDYLARVEGEGALYVKIEDRQVEEVKLKIFEPPRFFEAFLQGRSIEEAPDITSRICGICPVAYQMSSIHAIENALELKITPPIRELRRLLYCGEWIESHVLHMGMLHAPDFLGYEDAMSMAKDHPEHVKRCLKIKKIGNQIVQTLGGREIHPINAKIGGFYSIPSQKEFNILLEKLKWGLEESLFFLKWCSGLEFLEYNCSYEYVALHHPEEYAINEGTLISNKGLDIDIVHYEKNFHETHLQHSNALHSTLHANKNYFVGPMARYNLNYDQLSRIAQEAAKDAGLGRYCDNPFKSLLIRGVEVVYAFEEAIRILNQFIRPEYPFEEKRPRAAIGTAATEAPRGLLYHRYEITEDGKIKNAKIVPPTSQNQTTIENDLKQFIPMYLHLSDDKLKHHCEQMIRNYDPCISCATHFLDLTVERK